MFVRTLCGNEVRVDAVNEVRFNEEGVSLQLKGGGVRKASFESWQSAYRSTLRQMIPAQLGTFVLHLDSGDLSLVAREPVIAWCVDQIGMVYPVTFAGFRSSIDYNPLIQHPDGTVQDVLGVHESFEAWLSDVRLQHSIDVQTVEAAKRVVN